MITRYIVVYGYSTPLVAVSQCQSANMIHLTHPIGPSLVHHHVITTAAHPLIFDGCQMVRGVHLVVAEFNSRATAATAATPREPRVCLRTASGEWGYARCASGSG